MLFAALAGFVFGFIGSVPVAGPIAVLVLERSLAHRYSDAEGIAVGGAVAESAYAGAAFLGLGFLIRSYPIVLVGARAIGAIVLFGVAYALYRGGERVIETAKTEIGTVYRFGEANGPEDPGADAFDCSGFTQWAWATVGVGLPHSAQWQLAAPNVSNFHDESLARPGDLVFMHFPINRGIPPWQASHVGLWMRRGIVIDTRNPINSPVGIRPSAGVIGFGRPR